MFCLSQSPPTTQTSLRKLTYGIVDLWLKRQIHLSPLLHTLRYHLERYLAQKLRNILKEREKVSVGTDGKIGTCTLYQLKLQLKHDAKPFRKK